MLVVVLVEELPVVGVGGRSWVLRRVRRRSRSIWRVSGVVRRGEGDDLRVAIFFCVYLLGWLVE